MEELPEESDYKNDNSKEEKQKNRRQRLLCELLLEFAKNTTLHGLRYITERGLSLAEKLFWIVTFVTSLCLCVLLIEKVWTKWQTSPVIVTLSEQLVSVREVPFPAVTICPQAKISQQAYNYTEHKINLQIFAKKVLSNLSQTSREHEEALNSFLEKNPLISELRSVDLICSMYDFYDLPKPYVDYTAVHTIQKIAPKLHDILNYGTWQSIGFQAQEPGFHPVLTQEGVCFSFNNLRVEEIFHMDRIQLKYPYTQAYFPQREWSLENGYSDDSSHNAYSHYPFRGQASSTRPDLKVYLKEIVDRDILCDGVDRGFKVYLHHPADLPQSSLYYYSVISGQVASFAIKANVMKTSETLTNYPPHIRQCYFPSEKELHYFKVYTPNNCHLECLTNYTLNLCGCVWFHMPHNGKVKICSINMLFCLHRAVDGFSTEDANGNLCQCMPMCNSVQYEAEVLKTKFNANAYKKAINHAKEIINNHSQYEDSNEDTFDYTESNIKIELFFKEPRFLSMRRSELFGLTDFLANCGGLLGLFLGFSFLSLVEIFYFLTLRLACTFGRNNSVKKRGKGTQIKKSSLKKF